MKTNAPVIIVLLCTLALCSCAELLRGPSPPPPTPKPLSAKFFREKALSHEDRGELHQALLAWQIAAKIGNDQRIRQAIVALKQTIATEAELHFKNGLSHYRAGKFSKARSAFMDTILVLPTHKGARYYLKSRLHSTGQATYKVRRGDSYSKIASKIYGDAQKATLIAYYNDHDPVKPLLAGTTLLLPVLDSRSLHPRPDIYRWTVQAQRALDQKRYNKALAISQKIQKEISGHAKALQISDKANFAKGTDFLNNKQHLAALKHLKLVRPGYKGRNKAIAQARRHLQKKATVEKLQIAEKHLSQKEYDSVINATEEILGQSPTNSQAKALQNEARYAIGKQFIEDGKHVSAAKMLQKTDPSYKDTRQLLSLAEARIRSQAEIHYRKGVNHFINEELEDAIAEWRQTLILVPDHPKAHQDVKNAMRLLKKYKTFKSKPK